MRSTAEPVRAEPLDLLLQRRLHLGDLLVEGDEPALAPQLALADRLELGAQLRDDLRQLVAAALVSVISLAARLRHGRESTPSVTMSHGLVVDGETVSLLIVSAMPSAATRSSPRPAEALEDRLVAAMLECIGRWGVAKTTADDIARAAGVSRATLYRAFPGGKDVAFEALLRHELGRFFARVEGRLQRRRHPRRPARGRRRRGGPVPARPRGARLPAAPRAQPGDPRPTATCSAGSPSPPASSPRHLARFVPDPRSPPRAPSWSSACCSPTPPTPARRSTSPTPTACAASCAPSSSLR